MSQAPMSITRLSDCSLLTVSGSLGRSTAADFGRALGESLSFSSLPVVVDLRSVDFIHSKAVKLLIQALRRARNAGVLMEILVSVPSALSLDVYSDF